MFCLTAIVNQPKYLLAYCSRRFDFHRTKDNSIKRLCTVACTREPGSKCKLGLTCRWIVVPSDWELNFGCIMWTCWCGWKFDGCVATKLKISLREQSDVSTAAPILLLHDAYAVLRSAWDNYRHFWLWVISRWSWCTDFVAHLWSHQRIKVGKICDACVIKNKCSFLYRDFPRCHEWLVKSIDFCDAFDSWLITLQFEV